MIGTLLLCGASGLLGYIIADAQHAWRDLARAKAETQALEDGLRALGGFQIVTDDRLPRNTALIVGATQEAPNGDGEAEQ